MKNVRFLASLACALGAAVLAAGCGGSSSSDATLSVDNQSTFRIVELHVVPVGSSDWGDNLLRAPLDPGDSLVLGVPCDTYAALLIDDAGVDCQIDSIDLCLNDADWIIRNSTCTSFGAAKAAREAAARASGSAAATMPDGATH
ncbi:MAG TPA: hypothetical protein VFK02_17715 [Kofleriaceae bacterium]|nr:hypothetical protein [Kofleriaceae bacterium]